MLMKNDSNHKDQTARNWTVILVCFAFAALCVFSVVQFLPFARAATPAAPSLYSNDFEKTDEGAVPKEMVVLSGEFAVKNIDGNKVLELPGEPLNSFGVLFGPESEALLSVSARIYGTPTAKRMPEFGVGLGDSNGYKLWLMPITNELEIIKGEDVKATVPFTWKPGSWTDFRLQVRKAGEGKFSVEGKAWEHGTAEPKEWMIAFAETEAPPAGRASVWGTPYSSTPIRFDDLVVSKATD
jgi:hypothetical protein